jgi:hypothetical protein
MRSFVLFSVKTSWRWKWRAMACPVLSCEKGWESSSTVTGKASMRDLALVYGRGSL